MRLAVMDTNVIVSAGIRPGSPPARLLMEWILDGQVQLVICPRIAREYREVVRRAKFSRYRFPPLWLEFVIEESMLLPDPASWPYAGPDPKDLTFLALAYAAGAWLVTGNLRHFPKAVQNGVTVLSPADYLAHLQGGGQPTA
jgi:putative PIN family toxin of toxin-antitoxin system